MKIFFWRSSHDEPGLAATAAFFSPVVAGAAAAAGAGAAGTSCIEPLQVTVSLPPAFGFLR